MKDEDGDRAGHLHTDGGGDESDSESSDVNGGNDDGNGIGKSLWC